MIIQHLIHFNYRKPACVFYPPNIAEILQQPAVVLLFLFFRLLRQFSPLQTEPTQDHYSTEKGWGGDNQIINSLYLVTKLFFVKKIGKCY